MTAGKARHPDVPARVVNAMLQRPKIIEVKLRPEALTLQQYTHQFHLHDADGKIIPGLTLNLFFNKWTDGHLKSVQVSLLYRMHRIFGLDMEPAFKVHEVCEPFKPCLHFSRIKGSHKQALAPNDKYIRFIETTRLWTLYTFKEI
ncbi:MAG: hypothetical protein Q6370_012375, partial [Candidatus Sigynarchaeota archaeon]